MEDVNLLMLVVEKEIGFGMIVAEVDFGYLEA
jgi:hypothetical protein